MSELQLWSICVVDCVIGIHETTINAVRETLFQASEDTCIHHNGNDCVSEKADAIVIRLADFSESSKVVTLFTREFGKLGMLAKGAKRQKNPFESAMDLLAESSIVFLRKQGALSILTEASLKQRFRPPATDLASLYAGYYIAELLDALLEEADPHEELYEDTVEAIGLLQQGNRRLRAVSRFEMRLLTELGQCPQFDHCLSCGAAIEDDAVDHLVHWVSQGGVLCDQCRVETFRSLELSPASFRLLRRLADRDDPIDDTVSLNKRQVREVRSVLDQLIAYNLERRPKMAKYLTF